MIFRAGDEAVDHAPNLAAAPCYDTPVLSTPIGRLRAIGFVEGISFLLLLGVAMPLKHFGGMPIATKVAGWPHGLLFVTLCVLLLQAKLEHDWPLKRAAMVFGAALLPFGPFLIDGRLKAWATEAQAEPGDGS
jgi:integral membrane protein